jgi:hypothetical protein
MSLVAAHASGKEFPTSPEKITQETLVKPINDLTPSIKKK